MKLNGYKIVSESAVPLAAIGTGLTGGALIGYKIGVSKYNQALKNAKLNVIRTQREKKSDPTKWKDVEWAQDYLRDLQTPEVKRKFIRKYVSKSAKFGALASVGGLAVRSRMLKKK